MLSSSEVRQFFEGDIEAAKAKLPFAMELDRRMRADRKASKSTLEVDGFYKTFDWGRVKCTYIHGQSVLRIFAHPVKRPVVPVEKPIISGERDIVKRVVIERTFLKLFCHFDMMTNPVLELGVHESNERDEVVSAIACAKIDMETLAIVEIVAINTNLLARPQSGLGVSIWDKDPANYDADPYNYRERTELPAAYDALLAFNPSIQEPTPVFGAKRRVERLSIPVTPKVSVSDPKYWDVSTGYALMGIGVFDFRENEDSAFSLPQPYRNDAPNTTNNIANQYLSLSVFEQVTAVANTATFYRWASYQMGQVYNQYQSPGPIVADYPIIGEHEYVVELNAYGDLFGKRIWGYKHPIGGMVFNGIIGWDNELDYTQDLNLYAPPEYYFGIRGPGAAGPFYWNSVSFNGQWDVLYPIKNFKVAGFSFFITDIMANVMLSTSSSASTIIGCYYWLTGFAGPQPLVRPSLIPENAVLIANAQAVITAAVTQAGGVMGDLSTLDDRLHTNPEAEFWTARGITNYDYRGRAGAMLLPAATAIVTGGYLCMERMICEDTITIKE